MINRRGLLEWLSRGLAACVAAMIGLPGIRFFLGGAQQLASDQSKFERVMRLKDLVPGRPTIVPIMGQKQDAWMRQDRQVIGRAWLIRDSDNSPAAGSEQTKVRALSGICPHMGCQVQAATGGKGFVCPCHRATFSVDGARLVDPRTGEPNHAPRDLDDMGCRIAQDDATGELWVEVMYEKFPIGVKREAVSV